MLLNSGNQRPGGSGFGGNGIIGLILLAVIIYVLFNIVGWIISLLYKIGGLFFAAAAVVDTSVVTDFFTKTVPGLWKRNWVIGLVFTLLCVALYPFVGLFLLGKALFRKQLEKRFPGYKEKREAAKEAARQQAATEREAARRREKQYVDFEEVPHDSPKAEDDFLDFEELPPGPEAERRPGGNKGGDDGYDELFR